MSWEKRDFRLEYGRSADDRFKLNSGIHAIAADVMSALSFELSVCCPYHLTVVVEPLDVYRKKVD
jgi:hypothetical protein